MEIRSRPKCILPIATLALLLAFAGCREVSEDPAAAGDAAPIETVTERTKTPEPPADYTGRTAPVKIGKVFEQAGKPGLRLFLFELEIASRRDGYAWLILLYYLDDPLSSSGIFAADEGSSTPFGATAYPDPKRGQVVLVSFYGREGFKAIRPPASGKIRAEKLLIYSHSYPSEMEVWEAKSLLVDGGTPLEAWLPFGTGSDPTTAPFVDQGANRVGNLDLDGNTNTQRQDYPAGGVKFVEARGVRKWKVPFKVSEER